MPLAHDSFASAYNPPPEGKAARSQLVVQHRLVVHSCRESALSRLHRPADEWSLSNYVRGKDLVQVTPQLGGFRVEPVNGLLALFRPWATVTAASLTAGKTAVTVSVHKPPPRLMAGLGALVFVLAFTVFLPSAVPDLGWIGGGACSVVLAGLMAWQFFRTIDQSAWRLHRELCRRLDGDEADARRRSWN